MAKSNYYYYKKTVNKFKLFRDIFLIYSLTVLTVIVFNSFFFQAYKVPSNSMLPTLEVNTRIIADKFSIGPRIPFSNSRFFDSTPTNLNRGDVVVFMSNEYYKKSIFFRIFATFLHTITFSLIDITNNLNPYDSNVYVKRIIGLPGDVIEFKISVDSKVQVYINGFLEQEVIVKDYTTVEENKNNSALLSSMVLQKEIVVPEKSYYLLGDNRISSSDSRVFGSIHANQIIGRAVFRYWPFSDFGVIP